MTYSGWKGSVLGSFTDLRNWSARIAPGDYYYQTQGVSTLTSSDSFTLNIGSRASSVPATLDVTGTNTTLGRGTLIEVAPFPAGLGNDYSSGRLATLNTSGTIVNDGTILTGGVLTGSSSLAMNVAGRLTNSGVIEAGSYSQIAIDLSSGPPNQRNTLTNAGTLLASDGRMTINGASPQMPGSYKGTLVNAGNIEVISGMIDINAPVVGSGTIDIHSGSVKLDSSFSGNVAFSGQGILEFGAPTTTFSGLIRGFGLGSTIELDNVGKGNEGNALGMTNQPGETILTVVEGYHAVGQYTLVGSYSQSDFKLTNAGGNAVVTWQPSVRTWIVNGGELRDRGNWSPTGGPNPGDTLNMSTGVASMNGGILPDALNLYATPSAAPTVNLSNGATLSVNATVASTSNSQPATINVTGSATLYLHVNDAPPGNVGTLVEHLYEFTGENGNFTLGSGITFHMDGALNDTGNGFGDSYTNHGVNTQTGNSTAVIDTNVLGTGSWNIGFGGTAAGVQFDGSVAAGQTVNSNGSFVTIAHPGEFAGKVDFTTSADGGQGRLQLSGLLNVSSFDLRNDMLTLYSGGKVVDTLQLQLSGAYEVVQAAWGVAIMAPTTPLSATGGGHLVAHA